MKQSYIRLHGNPVLFRSPGDESFLNYILDGIRYNATTDETYVYFNNMACTSEIGNALG
ncbi:MAG: hypothetical protein ABJB16_17630 [Saprospiraceae bacterium]